MMLMMKFISHDRQYTVQYIQYVNAMLMLMLLCVTDILVLLLAL